MSAATLPPSLNSLAGIAGRVVTPDHPDYDKARTVFYGGIDKRPSAIARVTNVDDVRRVIATARTKAMSWLSGVAATALSATARPTVDW
jgi:hypothetical protein